MINNKYLEEIIILLKDNLKNEIEIIKTYFYEINNSKTKEEFFYNLDNLYEYLEELKYIYINYNKEDSKTDKEIENNYKKIQDKLIKAIAEEIEKKKKIFKNFNEFDYLVSNMKKNSKEELFELLETVREYNFKQQANKLFSGVLKNSKKNKNLTEEEKKDINILIEIITKFNNQKSKRFELLGKFLIILRHDKDNFYKIYDKYKNKLGNKKNMNKIVEQFYNELNEKYVPEIYRNKEGQSGTIDALIEINGKLYGIDVTFDKKGEIDNKEGNSNLYQTIRHYIQLYEIAYRTGKKVGNYYFLANFNVSTNIRKLSSDEELSFESINNLQRYLHKAFVLDSGYNIRQNKFLYWIHKNGFKKFDEIIDYIKNNAENKDWTNFLIDELDKIDDIETNKYLLLNLNPDIMYPEAIKDLIKKQKNLLNKSMKYSPHGITEELIPDLLSDAISLELYFRSYKSYISILEQIFTSKSKLTDEEMIKIINISDKVINKIKESIVNLIITIKKYTKSEKGKKYLKNRKNLNEIVESFSNIDINKTILELINNISDIVKNNYSKYQKINSIKLLNTLSNIDHIIFSVKKFQEKEQQIQEKDISIIKEKINKLNSDIDNNNKLINKNNQTIETLKETLSLLPEENKIIIENQIQQLEEENNQLEQEINNLKKQIQQLEQELQELQNKDNNNDKIVDIEKLTRQELKKLKDEIIKKLKVFKEKLYSINKSNEKINIEEFNELLEQAKILEQYIINININYIKDIPKNDVEKIKVEIQQEIYLISDIYAKLDDIILNKNLFEKIDANYQKIAENKVKEYMNILLNNIVIKNNKINKKHNNKIKEYKKNILIK